MSIQKTMILVWALALVALTLAAAMQYQRHLPTENASRTTVQVGDEAVRVEVANTPELQARGLSGRTELSEGEGMLFVFKEVGTPGIWMKDMLFSIDILWADSKGVIITIEKNVSPGTYPKSFYPTREEAKYVLEVPSGFFDRHGIAEGMKIVIQ